MKISIITPSYNQGRFIEDAIQSVLAQNYTDFEHIVVDGGSTDDTVARLRNYPHLRWVSEADEGQSDALNKGFKMATGDVIGWLNCDDFYLPGAFHKVAEVLASEKVDGVYSDLQFCNADKQIVKCYKSHRSSKMLSLFHTYIPSETLFFKRIVVNNQVLVQKDLHICMDQEFVANLLHQNYRLKYVKACFSVFRWQGLNKSLDTPESRQIRLEEGLKIFNKYNGFVKLKEKKNINKELYSLVRNMLRVHRLILKVAS